MFASNPFAEISASTGEQSSGLAVIAYPDSLFMPAGFFIEHGFVETDVGSLPKQKQALYNYQRRSKVFLKNL